MGNGRELFALKGLESLYHLSTPEFLTALKKAEVKSEQKVGTQWFLEFAETASSLAETDEVKVTDPRGLMDASRRADTNISLEVYGASRDITYMKMTN